MEWKCDEDCQSTKICSSEDYFRATYGDIQYDETKCVSAGFEWHCNHADEFSQCHGGMCLGSQELCEKYDFEWECHNMLEDGTCAHGRCFDPAGEWACGLAETCNADCNVAFTDPAGTFTIMLRFNDLFSRYIVYSSGSSLK